MTSLATQKATEIRKYARRALSPLGVGYVDAAKLAREITASRFNSLTITPADVYRVLDRDAELGKCLRIGDTYFTP